MFMVMRRASSLDCSSALSRNPSPRHGKRAAGPQSAGRGMRDRRRRMLRTEVSTRDRLQPWARTKQAYPGVGVFLLATGGKVLAVIAVEWSDILVGVGTVENCALAVRQ